MSANDKQVAGSHYRKEIQHWDYVAANNLDYFQGQITKYVTRWREKGGIVDLEKGLHFLEKYIEVETAKLAAAGKDVDFADMLRSNHPAAANWPYTEAERERARERIARSHQMEEYDGTEPTSRYTNQDYD